MVGEERKEKEQSQLSQKRKDKIKYVGNACTVYVVIHCIHRFEVALPLSDVELLIPSKVPSTKPNIQLPPASGKRLTIFIFN